jgi:magnesium chelatase family protein
VDVPALAFSEIHAGRRGESSAAVRERVVAARELQLRRQGAPNAGLHPSGLRRLVRLSSAAEALLQVAVDRMGLSGRAHDRVLQVALTIHDLARPSTKPPPAPITLGSDEIAEALGYRRVDRRPPQVELPEASA